MNYFFIPKVLEECKYKRDCRNPIYPFMDSIFYKKQKNHLSELIKIFPQQLITQKPEGRTPFGIFAAICNQG